jgi:hypothetical protein
VGGLIGFMDGKVGDSTTSPMTSRGNLHSYASGNVSGRYDVGGLVGRLSSNGSVINAYSTGNVSADANFGGLVGFFSPGAEITNSHYDMGSVVITGLVTLRFDHQQWFADLGWVVSESICDLVQWGCAGWTGWQPRRKFVWRCRCFGLLQPFICSKSARLFGLCRSG